MRVVCILRTMVTKRINVTVPEDIANFLAAQSISPSRLLQDAAITEMDRRELATTGMEELSVEMWTLSEQPYTATFKGRWLIAPDDDVRSAGPGADAGAYWGVAMTAKGNVAVWIGHVNRGFAPELTTYATLDDALGDLPENVAELAEGTATGSVQLDI